MFKSYYEKDPFDRLPLKARHGLKSEYENSGLKTFFSSIFFILVVNPLKIAR